MEEGRWQVAGGSPSRRLITFSVEVRREVFVSLVDLWVPLALECNLPILRYDRPRVQGI